MQEDKPKPEYSAYVLAWLLWYFVITIPVVILVTLLYMVNMFAKVIPPYWTYYCLAIGLTGLQVALLGTASISLFRRHKLKPAWEPWPVPALARVSQGFVDLLG